MFTAAGALFSAVLLYQGMYHGMLPSHHQAFKNEAPTNVVSGSRAMAERLAAIADAAERIVRPDDPGDLFAFGTNQPALIPILRRKLEDTSDPLQRVSLRFQIAQQLVLAGLSKEALQELESVETALNHLSDAALPADQRAQEVANLHAAIGIAALRLGEQENCVLNHGAYSCLFPIDRAGVHQLQMGSRRAVAAFTRQLAIEPRPGAVWLLNLAYMTLGEYPAKVPQKWRISPEVFRSDYDIKRFPDVSMTTGLDIVGLAGGSIMEDFNGDGCQDIMISSWGLRDQLRFFRSGCNGEFVDRTREAGLLGQLGGINLVHGDYNNDGYADVLVLRGGWLRGQAGLIPNSLLRNNGNGTFTDVTEEARLLSFHPTHTAAWGDFNNDGYLDLFVGNEDSGERTHPVQLYRNNADGTFTEIAAQVGFGVMGIVKGVAWGDYNNDRLPDLYISRYGRSNLLFRNDGPLSKAEGARAGATAQWRFTDVTDLAGVGGPTFSFPTWFWDYDNDGWLDIFVGGFDKSPIDVVADLYFGVPHHEGVSRLYHNNADGTFRDMTVEAKLDRVLNIMGANFGDLDNDGWLDVYVGTGAPDLTTLMPNRMFRNANGKFFQDVTTSGGFGHLQKGHGISFGDLDNDGDQDVYEVIGGWFSGDTYQNVLFENPGHGHHWITICLEGTRSNRMGVGARLKIRIQTPTGAREVHSTVSSGGSFGDSTLQQEIGLGDATSIERIEVTWPAGGDSQVFRAVAMDQFVRIREGDDRVVPLARRSFALGGSARRERTQ